MSILASHNSKWLDDFRMIRSPAEQLPLCDAPQKALTADEGNKLYEDLLSQFMQESPILPPPPGLEDLTLLLLKFQQNEISFINYQIKDHCDQIDRKKNERMALMAAQIKKMQENFEKTNQSNAWGMFGKVVTWLSSLFTIALGGVAIGTGAGTGAGIAMILSGTALLSTQLASEFGLFDKIAGDLAGKDLEKKAAILQQMQIWSMVTSICLSLGSLASGYATLLSSGAMSAVSTTAQSVLQVASGTAAIGKGVSESARLETEGDSKFYQGQITLVGDTLKDLTKENDIRTKRWSEWTKWAYEIIQAEAAKRDAIRRLFNEVGPAPAA